ncbi:hypothetical protein B9Z19DRAFT_675392 [Tuber borchii]|uniref:Uncharacterized protein n=1 Tax=Tuber borchii TaxID=42251 RepID=A0A2T6ZAG6_TUBBO|nr:hypothetical protein B9Z19DRAFT_675392 [Tuber borchii]
MSDTLSSLPQMRGSKTVRAPMKSRLSCNLLSNLLTTTTTPPPPPPTSSCRSREIIVTLSTTRNKYEYFLGLYSRITPWVSLSHTATDGMERSLLMLWRLSNTALRASRETRSPVNIRVFFAIRPNFTTKPFTQPFMAYFGFFLAALDVLLQPLLCSDVLVSCIKHLKMCHRVFSLVV